MSNSKAKASGLTASKKNLNNVKRTPNVQKALVPVPSFCKREELCSLSECRKIASLDATSMTTDSSFVDSNIYSYYLVTNTWLFQFEEVIGRDYLDIVNYMLNHGLVALISLCDGYALRCIEAQMKIENYFDLETSSHAGKDTRFLCGVITGCEDLQQVLQVLRFPKRFCPTKSDIILRNGIGSFIASNNKCKALNKALLGGSRGLVPPRKQWVPGKGYQPIVSREGQLINLIHQQKSRPLPHTYRDRLIRDVAAKVDQMLKGINVDYELGKFSNGSAYDARAPLGQKLQAFSRIQPYFDSPLYPLQQKGTAKCDGLQADDFKCRVTAVPKSYKTPRIIAMEPSYRQYHMQAVRLAMESILIKNGYGEMLDFHNQEVNRDACYDASLYGCYATIDLSAASDSIARELIWRIFPPELSTEFHKYLSRVMEIDGTDRVIHMFSTSGSALTFPVESVLFLAICLVAADDYQIWQNREAHHPFVFGDDMIVDISVFELVCDYLCMLGFTINPGKSYAGGGYRESCGVEYLYGLDTSVKYFPRQELLFRKSSLPNTLSSLCALQHRLYDNSRCRYFLVAFIRAIEPRMTSHSPGMECSDLWEASPRWLVSHCATANKNKPEVSIRELHLVCDSEYPPIQWSEDEIRIRHNIEMWRYRSFLKSGPQYEDGLLELLGVSQKSLPVEQLMKLPKEVWRYSKE